MAVLDPVVFRELPVIRKIIADETWLEGERRGCWVAADDPVVRENVCFVILRIGAEMRANIMAGCEAAMAATTQPEAPRPASEYQPHAA